MKTPGYEKLADVLHRAYDQAASGKGRDRHARGEPFHEQVMQIGAQKFGVGSLLFQAFKKSEESQRLPTDRAIAELLGAINYLAGAVIALEQHVPNAVQTTEEGPDAELPTVFCECPSLAKCAIATNPGLRMTRACSCSPGGPFARI